MPTTAPAAEPVKWTKIRLRVLYQLVHCVPVRLRWRYRTKREAGGRKVLCLLSPRGAWWRLKLQQGFWITPTSAPLRQRKKGSVPSIETPADPIPATALATANTTD